MQEINSTCIGIEKGPLASFVNMVTHLGVPQTDKFLYLVTECRIFKGRSCPFEVEPNAMRLFRDAFYGCEESENIIRNKTVRCIYTVRSKSHASHALKYILIGITECNSTLFTTEKIYTAQIVQALNCIKTQFRIS